MKKYIAEFHIKNMKIGKGTHYGQYEFTVKNNKIIPDKKYVKDIMVNDLGIDENILEITSINLK